MMTCFPGRTTRKRWLTWTTCTLVITTRETCTARWRSATRLQEFLKATDYGGFVEILPGDHSNYKGPELMDRFNREMAEHFAAGLKTSPEPPARTQGTSP
jgi:hypothetical protein